jgi:hypothetical protein
MTASPPLAVDLDPYLQYWPVIGVGCSVGLIALTVLSIRHFRRPVRHLPPPGPYLGPEDALKDSDWQLDPRAYSDRREKVRREGKPVRILIASPLFKNQVEPGYVLDRSTGGLRVAMLSAMAPGSTVQVRAENAPDTTPWVTLIVRNCRHAGQHYELGCEFDKTPPWNVLLLFG